MDRVPADDILAANARSADLVNHPDYEIVRKLGNGTGVVYLARNRLMGRHEVLRIIGPEIIARPGVRDHFLREIRSVAKLRHPNIVTAYSGFRWEESLVFAMEYAEGLDLARLVKASGPLPITHACSFVYQAALGLQHAHRARLVHRDIKPGNLMLTRKGSRAIVKVLDFGVAKAGREQGALSVFGLSVRDRESETTDDPTTAGQLVGTPDYIAPEQIADAHSADIRADIYSLGCTLYFLLSGRPPFQGATVQDVLQTQYSMNALPLNKARPNVPAELAALVAKAMAKGPDERFQTPEELANALAPFFKNRRMAGDTPDFGGSSPAAHGPPLGQTSPPQAADADAASSGGSAGNVTAVWSNLIDLSELPDDFDEDPADGLSRWPRSVIAGAVAGLAAALLLVGSIIGVKALRFDSATVVSRKANMPPGADAKTERTLATSSPAGDPDRETRTRGPAAQNEAIVDRKAKLGPESKLIPMGEPALALASHPTIKPAAVSSRDVSLPAPGARPVIALSATHDVREIASFKAPGQVLQARLLPDNQRVLYETAGNARGLWVGNIQDQNNPRKLEGHDSDWVQLALAGDGRLGVALEKDRSLSVWDVETGKSRHLRSRDRAAMTALTLSPDGRRAVYVVGDAFHIRDLITGGVKEQRGRSESAVLQIAFRPDGRAIVTAHVDRTIRSYSLENTREGPRMPNQFDVTDLAVFPIGQRVLASCSDGTVSVWDLKTGRKLREIVVAANGRFGDKSREEVVAAGGVVAVALSPDGQRALFGSGNLMVLWDMETGEELKRVNHPGKVGHVGFSPDGRYAVSSSGVTVRIWELPPGRKPGELPPLIEVAHYLGEERDGAEWAVVAPDGQRILACGWPEKVRVFDRATGQFIRLDKLGGAALAISRGGQRVLSASADKVMRLWELSSGQVVQELRGHTELIFNMAFSADGRMAYSTSGGNEPFVDGSDSDIRVWDLVTGSQIGKLEGHKGIVRSVAVSPDGRRVLSAGWSDMTLILWDTVTGRLLSRLNGHTNKVNCIAFLPDGRRAVSGGEDATLRIWDLDTGKELDRICGPHVLGWIAVSPDGRRLLSASFWGRELCLWDLEAKKPTARINFGGVPPHRGSFAPDGRHAVWGGSDGVVRMYRLTQLDPANRPPARAQSVAAGTRMSPLRGLGPGTLPQASAARL